MKKFLSLLLAVIMVMAIAVPAFAADSEEDLKIEKTTLYEDDNVSVILKGASIDSYYGLQLKLVLENFSEENTYTVSTEKETVNGFPASSYLYEELQPEDKTTKDVAFSEYFDDVEFDKTTAISFDLKIRENDDYSNYIITPVTVYPYGEEEAVYFNRADGATDFVIHDDEFCKVVIVGAYLDKWDGYKIRAYYENYQDYTISMSTDEGTVNGEDYDFWFYITMNPKTCGYQDLSFYSSDLEEANIADPMAEIQKLTFDHRIYNSDDYSQDYIVKDKPIEYDVVAMDVEAEKANVSYLPAGDAPAAAPAEGGAGLDEFGIAYNFGDGWEISTEEDGYEFFASNTSTFSNVSCIVMDFPLSADMYISTVKGSFEGNDTYSTVEAQDVTFAGQECKALYLEGETSGFALKQEQICVKNGDRMALFTFTAMADDSLEDMMAIFTKA